MSHDSMTPETDYEALVHAHFDGVLTDEQAEQLRVWLLADPEHARVFARKAQEHQHLRQVFSGERVSHLAGRIGAAEDEALSIDQLALLEDHGDETALVDITARLDRERRAKHAPRPGGSVDRSARRDGLELPGLPVWLALAAVLGLAVWLGITFGGSDAPTKQNNLTDANPPSGLVRRPLVAPEPRPMAQLVATRRAQWAPGGTTPGDGGAMGVGVYRLEAGYAQLAMGDGAEVILEGPASLTLHSGSRVALETGSLSAYVPEGSEGFIVDTPAGRVLDLGTAFGVEVLVDGRVDVHVMEGQVVASLRDDGESRPLRAGQARRMDPEAGRIDRVPTHTQRFPRDWEQVERSVRVSGAVRYLYDTPESVRAGALEDNEVLFLLPERRGVTVPASPLLCDFMQPGRYDALSNVVGSARGGTVVDSYLLHYDRVGAPDGGLVFVEGTIHFDRPIVGVIAGSARIEASDALFAVDGVRYPMRNYPGRGFEGLDRFPMEQDVVEISDDRRTLRVRLGTSTNIDQLRVLVEAMP